MQVFHGAGEDRRQRLDKHQPTGMFYRGINSDHVCGP
jgi:hypothetical protein